MTSVTYEDDCLPNKIYLNIHYTGKGAFIAVYDRMKETMKKVWEVESKDWWERLFRYDTPDGSFQATMFVDKTLDRFSKLVIEVQMQGLQPLDGSDGFVDINFGGVIKTTFGGNSVIENFDNPIYRLTVRLYRLWFYDKQRRSYLKIWCDKKLLEFKRTVQEILNIRPDQGESLLEQQEANLI
ncbi:hypothetical protein A3K63_03655 [Candidatus Micrarchaeota archaeon RBG_16_49_10]|nr:MAG: hypothetical protein A3K63_03655 [Candidatus Micrarchaeota archaeon RBG_16_49_10]